MSAIKTKILVFGEIEFRLSMGLDGLNQEGSFQLDTVYRKSNLVFYSRVLKRSRKY